MRVQLAPADIREARIIRDKVNARIFAIRDRLSQNPNVTGVDRVPRELRSHQPACKPE